MPKLPEIVPTTDDEKKVEETVDNEKKVEETTMEEPAEKKSTLKIECKAFIPKPVVIETPAPAIVVAKQPSQVIGLGGFGNKSTF